MPEVEAREALSMPEAASLYGVSRKIIETAVRSGALPAKHIGAGEERLRIRIALADLRAWWAQLPDV